MLLEINTEIEINKGMKEVWEVLMNFEEYPHWNPFVKSIKGEKRHGGKLAIELDGMKFKPTIKIFKENEELTWLGHLGFKGIFDGRHSFKLVKITNGKTKFIHSEKFSGILVRFFKKKLTGETKDGFKAMNEALKKQVENNCKSGN